MYEHSRITFSFNFIVVTVALLSVNPVTNLVTCLYNVAPSFPSRRQLCAVCCDLSNALHCAPHFILLQELVACWLSAGCAVKLRSYITDRLHDVRITDIISSPFPVLS